MKKSSLKGPTTGDNCPGINDFLRPTMRYIDCPTCKELMEIWSDESSAVCLSCKVVYEVPDTDSSCLTYCEYADQCREIIKERAGV